MVITSGVSKSGYKLSMTCHLLRGCNSNLIIAATSRIIDRIDSDSSASVLVLLAVAVSKGFDEVILLPSWHSLVQLVLHAKLSLALSGGA